MNLTLTFEEAVEELEAGSEIVLECGNYDYTIGPADTFIGGEGQDGYISEALGNVLYSSAERVLKESISYLEQEGHVSITV